MRNRWCNMCGKKFEIWDEQEDFSIYKHCIGYGSRFDGHELRLDLCCDCMDNIIRDCMLDPAEHDWEADRLQHHFRP